jgi:hypothetical protein
MSNHQDPKAIIVMRWLRDEKKGIWLLVLDNLDDDVVLSLPQTAADSPGGNLVTVIVSAGDRCQRIFHKARTGLF